MNIKDIKNWSPEIEKQITGKWRKSEKFRFNPKTKKKIYSIDTPPPYVNAPVHIGQAVTYCYMDFFARYKRMKGYDVIFPLGLDRNGLPIEMAAEKKFNISPFKIGRDKFVELCKKLLEETSTETQDTFAKFGISFTSYKEGKHLGAVYKTDSPEYRCITQATFIELFKKGLVYEDTRINNWDPKLQTTLADSEVDYKDIQSNFNYVRWKIKETGEEIIIGTTRPELICTCGMVLFNPKDTKYKHLEGKTAISPIFEKEVGIRSHPLAEIGKGTGLVMMCSAGDLSDIQFFREQNLNPEIAIEKDGRMNSVAGVLKGLKVSEARDKIVELLKEQNLLVKQEPITHRIPISERSGAEIEFIKMPEYYLKQVEFKEEIRKIGKKINFYPEGAREILNKWLDSISIDWPISRRRFYATPIPLWNSEDGLIALGKSGKYYEPWKTPPKKDFEVWKKGKKVGLVKDFKNAKWKGEERVFDTWMDSSISELVLLKYKGDEKFFKKSYPCSLRPQGKEILRTWLYYTLLRGYLETRKACFEDVWVNQHIVDAKGYKMSKSKGNVIDPKKLLKRYGGEAIRLWAATEGDLARQDLRCSEDRIKGELKTINKFLNITKFITQFKRPKKITKLTFLDQVFIDYLDYEINHIEFNYDRYNFYKPAIFLRGFLWEEFASHYLELVKARVYNEKGKFTQQEKKSAIYTLYHILEKLIILFNPIIPVVTHILAQKLKLKIDKFPKINYDVIKKRVRIKDELLLVNEIVKFNRKVWSEKKSKELSLKSPVSGIEIPKRLRPFEKDLKECHNLN